MRLLLPVVLFVVGLLAYTQAQGQTCTTLADIYIVLTASDTMVELPQLMAGARSGLGNLFARTIPNRRTGPQISVCSYGTTAQEQITHGQGLAIGNIQMVGGISHLDLGIECARMSSQANRRPGVPQYMVLIVGEDPLGFGGADYTLESVEQIRLARADGFTRISLTTVTDNVYPELITELGDADYLLHIESDFSEFERRTNQGQGQPTVDPIIWRQYCPEEITTTTTTTTTTTPPPPPRTGLCDDCIIIEGIGYNYFAGDCRKFVQCFFDDRQPPYMIKWTAPGTLWDKTQVQQHWPHDVICEWDTCTTEGVGFSAYGDERHCAAYWQCADIDGMWRTEKFFCCPDPLNEIWDDNTKACRAITDGPGCEDPCPFIRPTPDPLCNHDVRDDPRFYFDIRDLDAEDSACDLGMVFDVEKCTCVGTPEESCFPIFHVDFEGGLIEDKSPNKFWIGVNGSVIPEQDSQSSEWYGRFDGKSEMFIAGLSNLDLMQDWAFVVRYDAENNQNRRAALIGSTNCAKKQGSYHVALNPQNGRLEGFVKTKSRGNDRQDTATVNVPNSGLNKAVYIYHNATGLDINVDGVSSMADIDGTMWRDDSLCGFHIGWGQGLGYFEGRIYEVIVYRDPDCIPDVL